MTPEEIQAKIEAETEGLKNKNAALLDEISGYKGTLAKIKGLDLDTLIASSKELESLKKKGDEDRGEYKKLYEALQKTHDETVSSLNSKITDISSEFSNHKKKSIIISGLSKVEVDPVVIDVAAKDIFDKAAIDDKGVVTIDGKPVDTFMESWATSDVGKRFVISGNSGGGAGGDGGDGAGAKGNERFFDRKSKEYSLTEQSKLSKTNIAEYNRLRKIYG